MIGSDRTSEQELATTFSALGDPRRLELVARLQEKDSMSVTSLCYGMDISRQAVSKHLKALSEAQLVSSEKSGRETLYSLQFSRLEAANAFLVQLGTKWEHALERLKSHLE